MRIIYEYQYDNSDGEWRKLPHEVITIYELWINEEPETFCACTLPNEWVDSNTQYVKGFSPEPRFC